MKNITNLLFTIFFLCALNTHAIIQRVRINFTGPDGFTRYLLLGFTSDNAASDAYDYGYDALNIDNLANDLNWMIEDGRYVIQGVGAYDTSKSYRLGMFLTDPGSIQIRLNSLENFDEEIPVYVFDSLYNTFTLINNLDFEIDMPEGDYENRFFITFSNSIETIAEGNEAFLSTNDVVKNTVQIVHYKNLNQLVVKSDTEDLYIKRVELYDMNGKKSYEKNVHNTKVDIHTPLASGVYIAHVTTESNLKISKIIAL